MIELEFHQRPVDVPSDLRLYRRLAMLCVSMSECCRGGSASFKQLHLMNSLFIDDKFRELYFDFKLKKFSLKILCPSADPYLNRCVNYAIGAQLIEQKQIQSGFKVTLTKAGKDFVALLKEQKLAGDVFDICRRIGKISDTEAKTALGMEK